MALPFIYAILQSFKPLDEIFIFPPKFFVVNPTTENYTQLIRLASNSWVPFLRYLFNSVMVSIVATVGHVLLASMAAFPLAKLHFPGDKIVFSIKGIQSFLLYSSQDSKILPDSKNILISFLMHTKTLQMQITPAVFLCFIDFRQLFRNYSWSG